MRRIHIKTMRKRKEAAGKKYNEREFKKRRSIRREKEKITKKETVKEDTSRNS
jgi:hypothetical protein